MDEIMKAAMQSGVTSLVRGLIWLLAGWLGTKATTSEDTVTLIANAAGSLVAVAVSLWWSKVEKRKLLNTPPPSGAGGSSDDGQGR